MNPVPLALSLSSSVTDIGAIAAFAALLGIAILSLLVFSQAREIKRLREWAGRAPERATELEQRVSADAAARAQRPGAPVAPGGRVVPRKTPLVSAPVSTAVNATVAAAIPGAGATPANASPVPTVPTGVPVPSAPAAAVAAAKVTADSAPQGVEAQTPAPAGEAKAQQVGQGSAGVEGQAAADAVPREPVSVAEKTSAGEPLKSGDEPGDSAEKAPSPATAAARAGGTTARAPLPPSPSAPAPPGASSAPASPAVGSPAIPANSIPSVESKAPSRPPGPVSAARRSVPSRAVADTGDVAGRSSAPRGRAVSAATDAGARASSARTAGPAGDSSGPKYFKPERSPARAMVLIVGGVIVVVLLLVFAVSALKGGGSKAAATTTQSSTAGEVQPTTSSSHTTVQATPSNPAEIAVVVLNGTSTAGLAHHLASDLQQSGYTRAAASAAVPPGTHSTTAVEYTHGHHADAQAVAKTLDVNQVQAIEGTTAGLAGSATVVVLAGADQASQLGGGGAQSKGEPAAASTGASGEVGASGEGTAGNGN